MASPSEHLYENLSFSSLKNNPKLKRDLWFLLIAFVVMRIGSYIPVPGVNSQAWSAFFDNLPFANLLGLF